MEDPLYAELSRLERRLVDVLYSLGEATARDVARELGDPDGYDTVRVTLANLWKAGFLEREREGRAFVYAPSIPREEARRRRLSHVLETFFRDSPSLVVRTFLDLKEDELTEEELERIGSWIHEHTERDEG